MGVCGLWVDYQSILFLCLCFNVSYYVCMYVCAQGTMANKVYKVCMYVLMYDYIYVLFVCRV